AEKARSDPARLAELEDAFAQLKTLQRKHLRSFDELMTLRNKLRDDLSGLDLLDSRTDECEKKLSRAIEALKNACTVLSKKRRIGARSLEKKVNVELRSLGLIQAALQIELTP